MYATPLMEKNEITGYLVQIMEVTDRKQAEKKNANQLNELRRWHDAMLGREERILGIKREVNDLLVKAGKPAKYPSIDTDI